jgi:HEAT repeat protein
MDFSNEGRERPAQEERLVVPLLCERLKDPAVEVRRNAVRALRRYPWTAEEARAVAVRACREALRDEDSFVREWAALALQDTMNGPRRAAERRRLPDEGHR